MGTYKLIAMSSVSLPSVHELSPMAAKTLLAGTKTLLPSTSHTPKNDSSESNSPSDSSEETTTKQRSSKRLKQQQKKALAASLQLSRGRKRQGGPLAVTKAKQSNKSPYTFTL